MSFIPDNITDEGLQTAYNEADKHAWTPAELKAYEDIGIRETDVVQERIFAIKKSKAEGVKEGLKKGLEKGLEKGLFLSIKLLA